MGTFSTPNEARHRFSIEDIYRRKLRRSNSKEGEELVQFSGQGRLLRCSHHLSPLKFILALTLLGALITLLHSPPNCRGTDYSDSRPSIVNRWLWRHPDPRYESNSAINWQDIKKSLSHLKHKEYHSIGLLNFNSDEITHWKQTFPDSEHTQLHLPPVDEDVTWDTLYPEWIDEEEETEVPACPSLPNLELPRKRLDLIVVKLPCRSNGKDKNWSRDVARLHLQLAGSGIAASVKGDHPVHMLLISDCFPIPNLFTCKELVVNEGDVWLYRLNLNALREKIRLPVGSCELAVPLKEGGNIKEQRSSSNNYRGSGNPDREAYATILHSAHVYVCGAIAAAQSIRMSGSTRDLVILVDESISKYHRSGLESAGWNIRTIQRIRNPKAEKDAYNEWNYSKFRLWQLTDYDKVIFIDADLLVLRNIDFLFSALPEISATGNNATLFNSGVMVIEPSNCTFKLLMDNIDRFESYNGGDQGYLNEIFTWWHRIPKHMNFLKHFWMGDEEEVKLKKTELFGADPAVLYVLHYLGIKPWLCYRDYDCNWNSGIFREFASDVAHEKWWKVYDEMPRELKEFCALRSKDKAQLEWDRREAEKMRYEDGHWKLKVKDGRMKKCIDKLCDWKSMLKHWGETNWTMDDEAVYYPSPPTISTAALPAS